MSMTGVGHFRNPTRANNVCRERLKLELFSYAAVLVQVRVYCKFTCRLGQQVMYPKSFTSESI